MFCNMLWASYLGYGETMGLGFISLFLHSHIKLIFIWWGLCYNSPFLFLVMSILDLGFISPFLHLVMSTMGLVFISSLSSFGKVNNGVGLHLPSSLLGKVKNGFRLHLPFSSFGYVKNVWASSPLLSIW